MPGRVQTLIIGTTESYVAWCPECGYHSVDYLDRAWAGVIATRHRC